MTWAAILASALKAFSALASYFQQKQLLDAGKAQGREESHVKNYDEIRRANIARANAHKLRDPFDTDNQ